MTTDKNNNNKKETNTPNLTLCTHVPLQRELVKDILSLLRAAHVTSLNTPTLPGRMLLQRVIHHIVVQKRQVVVKRDRPAAGARGCILVQLFVVREVVQDLVVVGLCLNTGAATVPEDQLLFSLVAQPQIRHIEVDFL